MGRLKFNSQGKPIGVDGKLGDIDYRKGKKLQTSDSLSFLKEDKKIGDIFEKDFWSLYEDDSALKPLEFSNGKTQEDIVKEIYNLIKQGTKIIFLYGTCGTGKSAIALNLARLLARLRLLFQSKHFKISTKEIILKENIFLN